MTARAAVVVALGALPFLTACGTSATNVEGCRQVEVARCQRAPACNVPVEPPHRTSGSEVDACIRFYGDACLHGLVTANTPSPADVSGCVTAIREGSCPSAVLTPERLPACWWLSPSGPASLSADASTE
ncbi:MAG: hypothetical protein M3O36_01485 [Myxococcota bacterium]|nr:hypothetical protein [Myxococcota bacterium]